VHHPARAVLTGLVVLAAVAASPLTARAFDRVESLDPVAAGHSYVYYVREVDTDHQPIAGRSVTMSVQHAPAPDTTVAPADSSGHTTGPAGLSAKEVSGADGLAFFLLTTSKTPGDNEFTWQDGIYNGQVVVVGKPVPGTSPTPSPRPSASPTAVPRAAAGAKSPPVSGGGGAAASVRLPASRVPPLAAALLAALLVFLLVPSSLARRWGGVRLASLPPSPPRAAGAEAG
jgi:hypothetical protein